MRKRPTSCWLHSLTAIFALERKRLRWSLSLFSHLSFTASARSRPAQCHLQHACTFLNSNFKAIAPQTIRYKFTSWHGAMDLYSCDSGTLGDRDCWRDLYLGSLGRSLVDGFERETPANTTTLAHFCRVVSKFFANKPGLTSKCTTAYDVL